MLNSVKGYINLGGYMGSEREQNKAGK